MERPNYNKYSQLDEVESLLKNYPPPLPSIGQVKSVLNHLNHSKATGADGVPAWLLKRFSSFLAPIVHDIITASIKQCKYPSHHKHGLVTPVPKHTHQLTLVTILDKSLFCHAHIGENLRESTTTTQSK